MCSCLKWLKENEDQHGTFGERDVPRDNTWHENQAVIVKGLSINRGIIQLIKGMANILEHISGQIEYF